MGNASNDFWVNCVFIQKILTEFNASGCLHKKNGELLNNNNIIVIKEQYYFCTECLFTELENVKFGKYFCAFFFSNVSRWLLSDYVKVRWVLLVAMNAWFIIKQGLKWIKVRGHSSATRGKIFNAHFLEKVFVWNCYFD